MSLEWEGRLNSAFFVGSEFKSAEEEEEEHGTDMCVDMIIFEDSFYRRSLIIHSILRPLSTLCGRLKRNLFSHQQIV